MDPPIKLFGQTIAFTTSASSQDDATDGLGTTSSGAWEELSSSPQEGVDNGSESVVKSEVAKSCPASIPEFSSTGSNGADEEKLSSSPCEGYGVVHPFSEASEGGERSGTEGLDVEAGSGEEDDVNREDIGGKGSKTLRRPEKAVACPRCHSMETKFCYYNNYNVNQPRHFCKHCQRYWTAGGTLRNVPVGAGRRKNKHGSVVSPRQASDMGLVRSDEPDVAAPLLVANSGTITVPVQQIPVSSVVGVSRQCSPKGVIRVPVSGGSPEGVATLPYGMRVPSMETTYILASGEAVKPTDSGGVAVGLPPGVAPPGFNDVSRSVSEGDVMGEWPSKDGSAGGPTSIPSVKGGGTAIPTSHVKDANVTAAAWNGGGGANPGPHCAATGSFGYFNGGWPYGYNVGWSGGAAFCTGGIGSVGTPMAPPSPANVAAWGGAATLAARGMWTGMPGVPWPMPGLSWSPAGWGPPPWASMTPWAIGAGAPPGTAVAMPPGTPNGASAVPIPVSCPPTGPPAACTSTLGKHARAPSFDGNPAYAATVWAPKSLRMADPEEAMRSSVWRILGVGSHAPDMTTASTFKAFQPKSESKKIPDGDQQTVQATLHANPAAMSRSMYFQESN